MIRIESKKRMISIYTSGETLRIDDRVSDNSRVFQFLVEANELIRLGCIEMNHQTRYLRFKTNQIFPALRNDDSINVEIAV